MVQLTAARGTKALGAAFSGPAPKLCWGRELETKQAINRSIVDGLRIVRKV